jgi:hypothetical protein
MISHPEIAGDAVWLLRMRTTPSVAVDGALDFTDRRIMRSSLRAGPLVCATRAETLKA